MKRYMSAIFMGAEQVDITHTRRCSRRVRYFYAGGATGADFC